jgi:hypothetical protein
VSASWRQRRDSLFLSRLPVLEFSSQATVVPEKIKCHARSIYCTASLLVCLELKPNSYDYRTRLPSISNLKHYPPPTPSPAPQPTPDSLSPVVPSQPAAAPFVPVAEPRAKKTPPQGGSTQGEEEETEGPQAVATATTNLNSAKAEAKLVKALDYLVAINDSSDNPGQKWVINESILASLDRLFQAGDKEIRRDHRSFISQANNTHGLGPWPQPGQGKDQPRRYPSPG